jgi:hypothetical protein
MTIRHAAALALAGWYLMTPPMSNSAGKPYANSEAQLRHWWYFPNPENVFGHSRETALEFDSQRQCEFYKQNHLTGLLDRQRWPNLPQVTRDSAASAVCGSAGDPRLNGKVE